MLDTVFEIIGYLGMAMVLISFLMKDIRLIRFINLVGAVLSVIYAGFFIIFRGSPLIPVLILNSALTIIQIYYLIRIHLDNKKAKLTSE